MARGFLTCEYRDDLDGAWRLLVDADQALDPVRGWTTGLTAGLTPYPRRWSPRYVIGIDTTGRVVRTRVASPDAPLWSGAANTWLTSGNDGLSYLATVIARVGEKRRG